MIVIIGPTHAFIHKLFGCGLYNYPSPTHSICKDTVVDVLVS